MESILIKKLMCKISFFAIGLMYKFLKPVTSSLPDIRNYSSQLNWIVLLLINLVIVVSLRRDVIAPQLRVWVPHLTLNLFLLALLYYSRFQIKPVDRPTFLPLLIRLCTITGVGVMSIFFLEAVVFLFSDAAVLARPVVATTIYTMEILAGGVFLTSLLTGFKRLIMFQKTRLLMVAWRLFEYGLVTTTILSIFNIEFNTFFYNTMFVALAVLGLLLSVNLKWVGYLDFRQKLQALLVLSGQLVCLLFFGWFLYYYSADNHLLFYAEDNVLLLVLLSFALFCTGLSVLVIFFNLPTSSVFEKKLEDLDGIKQLQQSLRRNQSEEELYQLLLHNALKATDAQHGWICILGGREEALVVQPQELPALSVTSITAAFAEARLRRHLMNDGAGAECRKSAYHSNVLHPIYRSALALPMRVQEATYGFLVLLKNIPNGFNKDAVGIARLYTEQTCLSIENLQLLNETLRVERYEEELAIARRVKKSLLPSTICCNSDCQMAVISESADDVGGDYYDAYRLDDHRVALVVADVAGHGTSAAFTMSQLKGVFHSLVTQGLDVKKFILEANDALGRGLGRASFVTLVYGVLDSQARTFTFVRAGHCPILHFKKQKQQVVDYQGKGMGLGLLRNGAFQEHIEEQIVHYAPGDVLLLYTDGVIECRNSEGEEFGQARLAAYLQEQSAKESDGPQQFCEQLMQELYTFAGQQEIEDDFTTLVIKFS